MAAWSEIPVLGIGATYSEAIEPLLERDPELFDVLEIEPQTTWIRTRDQERPFRVEDQVLDHLARLPGRKIIHSVGLPVGGTRAPEAVELNLLKDAVRYFDSPWASDHLSFNQTREFATGFFLPPRQTLAGVQTAAAAINRLQDALLVPIAVETGVNYLRPRDDELPDGEFVARVVETANCGLLLDLHNVYCNSVNGRQPLKDFLDQLPLERVWEVHVAGGFEFDGFYLDAHSGAIPGPLHEVVEQVIPRLPNLKAIVFEIFPSFVAEVGLDLVRDQLEWLHGTWARRSHAERIGPTPVQLRSEAEPDLVPPDIWERALGRLVVGRSTDDEIGVELAHDPGVRVIERLIHEFRASMIVRVLRLTSRFLMLALGPAAFRTILADYWSKVTPQMYASLEADAFAHYLKELNLQVPHLGKILEFEQAVTATIIDGGTRIVHFDFEPLPLLRAIAEGRLPEEPAQQGDFEIELTPDGSELAGPDLEAVRQSVRFH
ncbi:MAG TPA: DUF692 family protein [Pyrinomonadaceae bacterium]|nr:DUF692 family protein [Pyrinomonadaceae bacterium]